MINVEQISFPLSVIEWFRGATTYNYDQLNRWCLIINRTTRGLDATNNKSKITQKSIK